MTVILTFEDIGEKTRYTARVHHWTAADRERHEQMGFHEGWGQCADQLAELLQRMEPPSGFLSLLSAPARRALAQAGVSTLAELSQHSETEILNLHGVGPKILPVLRQALADAGLAFASSTQ